MIFDSFAFLITESVHEEPVLPVNCRHRHEHYARDTEGGDARQKPDREAERAEEFGDNREQR